MLTHGSTVLRQPKRQVHGFVHLLLFISAISFSPLMSETRFILVLAFSSPIMLSCTPFYLPRRTVLFFQVNRIPLARVPGLCRVCVCSLFRPAWRLRAKLHCTKWSRPHRDKPRSLWHRSKSLRLRRGTCCMAFSTEHSWGFHSPFELPCRSRSVRSDFSRTDQCASTSLVPLTLMSFLPVTFNLVFWCLWLGPIGAGGRTRP